MTHAVFLCGPLCLPGVQQVLWRETPPARAARLVGYDLAALAPGLPVPRPATDAAVAGVLVALCDDSLARLSWFLGLWGAVAQSVQIETEGRPMAAVTHLTGQTQARGLDPWVAPPPDCDAEAVISRAVAELLDLSPKHPPESLRVRWPMALAHAASSLRALRAGDPVGLRTPRQRADVQTVTRNQPYAYFFALSEDTLRFRRFDGSDSPVVRRAGFILTDAVTVLPYDPQRDLVLVIEQFRYGPWLRGATNCWSLEPVAGRIDPFETPETCALREAREETGLVLQPDQLVAVGGAYPSPGAVSEYLYHYVALCDLGAEGGGVAGLDSEAEDIRSHVIPFARLLELIESGEVENGPLMLTAFWLAGYRARL